MKNPELERALDDMASARRELLALVSTAPPDSAGLARPGGWTLGRVLHHVIESEAVYAKLLAHQRGVAAPDLDAGEPSDGADAAAKLAATRSAVETLVDGIDDATLYRLVRFGHEEYSPLSVLENIASHDLDHFAQVAELIGDAPAERHTPKPASNIVVRPGTLDDLPRLTEIYNHYIINTPTTFDLEPFTVERRRTEWFEHYALTGRHRLLVAEQDGVVVGYTTASRFRPKRAYDTTVEMTIISAPEAIGRGIGQRLYEVIFDELRGEDIHVAMAGITLPNDASCALHERFGFRRAAVLREVGRKFGRYWDVAWYEKRLG